VTGYRIVPLKLHTYVCLYTVDKSDGWAFDLVAVNIWGL